MTLSAAVAAAIALRDECKALGFNQAALDEAGRKGFADGVFEESAEEVAEVLEEFYPDSSGGVEEALQSNKSAIALSDKLAQKLVSPGVF